MRQEDQGLAASISSNKREPLVSICVMAELLEGRIRSHVLNRKQRPTSGQAAAADEVIDMVKSYLK